MTEGEKEEFDLMRLVRSSEPIKLEGQHEFLMVVAHDPDMGGGIEAYGTTGNGTLRSRQDFLENLVLPVLQERLDEYPSGETYGVDPYIECSADAVLVSLRNASWLKFRNPKLTEIVFRANNTTDVWQSREGNYAGLPAKPHAVVDLEAAKNLGLEVCLFSVTLCGDLEPDMSMIEAYADFCRKARKLGLKHILEIFNPGLGPVSWLNAATKGEFINDSIVRLVASQECDYGPILLKIPFNTRESMAELTSFDTDLNVGIMGGSSGTSMDAFELANQAAECGARAAFFGRRIKNAVLPLEMSRLIREVGRGTMSPKLAVDEYHDEVGERPLPGGLTKEQDSEITLDALKKDGIA